MRQMFALVIGVEKYKSGSIWDLDSCVSDARRMSRWLLSDLGIPKSHVCMLLDEDATLQNIQASFLEHLVHNRNIQKGDALLFYFAGHGSIVATPDEWVDSNVTAREVEVLCPYDHDTKTEHGRVAGMSDRSLKALLQELSRVKGHNITVMVDSCFSPSLNKRDRRRIRWTPTQKATSDDLRQCLWKRAGISHECGGFYDDGITTHTLIAACGANETAAEGKDGGRFTTAFLEAVRATSLGRASYATLMKNILAKTGEEQRPLCLGQTSHLVFGSAPFLINSAFHSVSSYDEKRFRVEAGSIHGLDRGHELSIHSHNYSGQKNPAIASVVVQEIYPHYCLVHRKSFSTNQPFPKDCWALVKPPSTNKTINSLSWIQKIYAVLRSTKSALVPDQTGNSQSFFTEKKASAEPEQISTVETRRPISVV